MAVLASPHRPAPPRSPHTAPRRPDHPPPAPHRPPPPPPCQFIAEESSKNLLGAGKETVSAVIDAVSKFPPPPGGDSPRAVVEGTGGSTVGGMNGEGAARASMEPAKAVQVGRAEKARGGEVRNCSRMKKKT